MAEIFRRILAAALVFGVGLAVLGPRPAVAASLQVTRATLSNGMHVVVVHDPFAPVVSTILNYKAGSDDQSIAGLAHATEHMMFRGSKTLSSSQLMDSIDITGGSFDADTENEITQYFFTVPSQYLDIALNLERSRATGLLMEQSQWQQERGAITQEVTQDNSNAFYRLNERMTQALLGGTPYAKNGLGTVHDFAHTINHPQLINFYQKWYHPNNAVYIIVGDVDGPSTVERVKQLFGDLPSKPLPARDPVVLHPIVPKTLRDTSDQPYTAALIGYRLPGFDDKDYAAAQILGDVLSSQRGDLYALAASGQALYAGFEQQSFPKASIGYAVALVPVTTKPENADHLVRGVLDSYRKSGVPADLVEASKRREIAQLEFNGTSIEGLAFEWSQAVAVQGLSSPDDMIAAFDKVTTDDVNRVLREYVVDSKAITAYAVPKNLGKVSSGSSELAKEVNTIPPSKHERLPAFAQNVLAHLQVPPETLHPVSMMLDNGIRLIVQPEHSTHTVTVAGQILNNAQVQEPLGKDGVDDVTTALLPYGTTTYDRLGFQAALDKIAATTEAGTDFNLQVLSSDFDRGVQLLADEELHPRFDPKDFDVVKQQNVGSLTGVVTSPDHLTEVALHKALYPAGDPEQRYATPQSVGALTLDDVKKWYETAYRPDLATIVVVGDTTPDQAKASIVKYFGAWKAQGPKPSVYPPAVPMNQPSAANVPATGRVQSSVQLVETTGMLRTDPDFAPLQVANTILSGGFYSSLLYHDLREVHGYVYYVGSRLQTGKVRSTFSVSYGCDPKNVLPAQSLVVNDLRVMQRQPVPSDRLMRAKAQLMGEIPISQASYDGVSALFLRYAGLELPLDQYSIDAQRELNTAPEQIQAAMSKWIRPNGFVRIVTGPGPQ
ncbi:MAG: M16 family metallopeptidase [Vulcanimicrobiaceae bacterium]